LYVVEKETAARAHGGRNVATFYLHAPISTALLLFIIKRGNVCTSFRQDSQIPSQPNSQVSVQGFFSHGARIYCSRVHAPLFTTAVHSQRGLNGRLAASFCAAGNERERDAV
jgi:hypothetical protein